MLNVPDATKDARFAGNPLLTDAPHIRAYVGGPLYTGDGHAIGTLCAIDTRPRKFDEEDVSALRDLAKIIEESIHARELAASTASVLHFATEREK